jgi:hypothetical protein
MTSGKQKRRILDARRKAQAESTRLRTQAEAKDKARAAVADSTAVRVNRDALAPCNSYGEPDFVERGYYVDQRFECARCGAVETWRARQQKWWYEVAKGKVYSTARYCTNCRRKRREGRWKEEDVVEVRRRMFAGHGMTLPLPPG